MKTNSITIASLFLFTLICVQCSTPTAEVATKANIKVEEQKSPKPIAVNKVAPPVSKDSKPTLKEKTVKSTTPTESVVKPKTSKTKNKAPEIVEEEKKEVVKEVKKAVTKKKTPPKKKRAKSKIEFEHLAYEFGTINQGDIVKHDFKFKNTGKAPLVIKRVDVSCGCTFPSYPFIPIEPGKEGTIGVTFDSKNKIGRQKPTITVVTNGSPRTLKLNLLGFVE